MLLDDGSQVLSLIPVINSRITGKLSPGDSELIFEATGSDEESVNLAANIFAHNLIDRSFKIKAITVDYGTRTVLTPSSFNEKVRLSLKDVENLTGLNLSQAEVKKLLEKARFGYSNGEVAVPDFRRDVLHVFDIVEDIAIMYGYGNIESAPLQDYTAGATGRLVSFADRLRLIAVGLGFQEILSPILS